MKTIDLGNGLASLVDDEDFEYLSQFKWYATKRGHKLYAKRNLPRDNGIRRSESIHRVVMKYPKGVSIDHIDGDGLNNQKSNLRICTSSQNMANQPKQRSNTSGYKGVCWNKNVSKWQVQIRFQWEPIYLGVFEDKIEAAKVYDAKALELFGEFAQLNFPEVKNG